LLQHKIPQQAAATQHNTTNNKTSMAMALLFPLFPWQVFIHVEYIHGNAQVTQKTEDGSMIGTIARGAPGGQVNA